MVYGDTLRNWYYLIGALIFIIAMSVKAFAFWIPPILDFPPVLLHPPHMEGGVEPVIEDMMHEMEKSKTGYTIDEDGKVSYLV